MVLEENQIQSVVVEAVTPITLTTVTSASTTSLTTPTTHPLFHCYNGKRIDNSDLLEAIDRTDHELSETFDLVNSVLG